MKKLNWLILFGMALLLAGCSNVATPIATLKAITTEAIPTQITVTQTRTNTSTHEPTPTPIPILTTSVPWPPEGTSAIDALTVFWNEDGTSLNIASTRDINGGRPIQWSTFSFEEQSLKFLPKPPKLPRNPYGYNFYFYPEFRGSKSPTGRYEIKILHLPSKSDNSSDLKSYVRLIDRSTGQEFNIFDSESPDLAFNGGEWFADESGGVLVIGPAEFGNELYILDTISPGINAFNDSTGIQLINIYEWTLSPDGTMLAFIDGQGALRILSLDGLHECIIEEGSATNLRWQLNGKKLFYYYGPDFDNLERINAYDFDQIKISTVLEESDLKDSNIFGRPFEVSPDGDSLAMWSTQDIRLIELPLR